MTAPHGSNGVPGDPEPNADPITDRDFMSGDMGRSYGHALMEVPAILIVMGLLILLGIWAGCRRR